MRSYYGTRDLLVAYIYTDTYTYMCTYMEKEMATHSSILSWRIPWTEKPGRLQSMGGPPGTTEHKEEELIRDR